MKKLVLWNLNNRLFRFQQLLDIPWIFLLILFFICLVSLLLLYSAGNGSFSPWCLRQFVKFILGFIIMFTIAATPIRLWYSFAYAFYGITLGLLLLTTLMGVIGMGAQRWINLFIFQFQPSELMRVSIILALSRYFHQNPISQQQGLFIHLIVPIFLVLIPVLITLKQPDLGTAMLLLLESGGLFFFAGVSWKFFAFVFATFSAACPMLWHFLHNYQRDRILMFLNPSSDPLGAGYHIIQSKIAIGSGGIFGKGFLNGTQSSLNFLPEKHTDFIFTLLSEEFGFLGGIILFVLYGILILLNLSFALQVKDPFRRNVIAGLTLSFSCYALINIAMVTGLLPVVGIPLPLISYGGSAIITIMGSFGIILSALTYRLSMQQHNLQNWHN